jgi:signal transduction histidine kinase
MQREADRMVDAAFAPKNHFADRLRQSIAGIVLGGAGLALITFVGAGFERYRGAAALLYLMVVALVSLTGDFVSSAAVAITAILCLRYFFAPPAATAGIDKPLQVAALVTFLATAAIITRLISKMRQSLVDNHTLRDQLQTTIDTIPTMVACAKPDGSTEFHSKRWREFLGSTDLNTAGVSVHPDDRPGFEKNWREASSTGEPFEAEARFHHANRGFCWFLARAVPQHDASGQIIRWYATLTDIEDRKRVEETLRQAQADLARVSRATTMGELTASLAHEVNQPIAAAVTNANTCLRWLAGDTPNLDEARAAATRIVKDGTRAAEIISRIRLLFKKGTPERELVDVNEAIREMMVLLRSEATRYRVPIRTDLAADLPEVMGDRVQLQQVLMNLMLNGIDAMKEVNGTRELVIKSQRGENEELLVSVSDTGVGLPAQQTDQIFNPFFTTKSHGTGMGLSISRSIVESHGGRLWAAGNSPRGASFYFTLPANVEVHE